MNNTDIKFTGFGTTAPFLAMSEFLQAQTRQAVNDRMNIIEQAKQEALEMMKDAPTYAYRLVQGSEGLRTEAI